MSQMDRRDDRTSCALSGGCTSRPERSHDRDRDRRAHHGAAPRAPEPLETIAERCGGCGAQATGTDAAGSTWCDACWAKPARDRGSAAPIGRRAPAPATKPGCLCEEIDPSDQPCVVCEVREQELARQREAETPPAPPKRTIAAKRTRARRGRG